MSAKGYWIAFVVGVSAGAAVALLYAPESGVKTRKRLGRKFDDGVETLEDAADYLKEQAENLAKQAQSTLRRTQGQVEDAIGKATDVVQGAVKSAQSLM